MSTFALLLDLTLTDVSEINDRYFEEPEKFKPERWYGLAPSDFEKVTTFSVGVYLTCPPSCTPSTLSLTALRCRSSRMPGPQVRRDGSGMFPHVLDAGLSCRGFAVAGGDFAWVEGEGVGCEYHGYAGG